MELYEKHERMETKAVHTFMTLSWEYLLHKSVTWTILATSLYNRRGWNNSHPGQFWNFLVGKGVWRVIVIGANCSGWELSGCVCGGGGGMGMELPGCRKICDMLSLWLGCIQSLRWINAVFHFIRAFAESKQATQDFFKPMEEHFLTQKRWNASKAANSSFPVCTSHFWPLLFSHLSSVHH